MSSLKVFVYGTLKPGECNYPHYCAGKVVEEKKAIAYGKIFHLPNFGYPAMTLGEGKVEGYLLTFANPDAIYHLDSLENYDEGRSREKNLYDRQRIEVYDLEGRSLGFAWAYFMTSEQVTGFGGVCLPSGCWPSTK